MIDKTMKNLLAGASKGYGLVERGEPREAIAVYGEVLALARKAGVDSAHLHWAYAVACDYAGELEMAFEQIQTAISKDPLALSFRTSFDVIGRRIREALADSDRRADDPSTPRLYALLLRAGEADVDSHVAMTRYQLATDKAPEARALAAALTLLYPMSPAAWEARAAVARAEGDVAATEEARLEAAALAVTSPPFPVPGDARA